MKEVQKFLFALSWLTIEQMSGLFNKSRSTINKHILNIFKEKELLEEDTVRKIGNSDFSTKPTNFYNLDVIISVGYRVKSVQGTRFRQWATQRLKESIVKSFTMDDERLNPSPVLPLTRDGDFKVSPDKGETLEGLIFCPCQ
jgi:hypothetical protein